MSNEKIMVRFMVREIRFFVFELLASKSIKYNSYINKHLKFKIPSNVYAGI